MFGMRQSGPWLRPARRAALALRSPLGTGGVSLLCGSAGGVPAVRGSRREAALGRRQIETLELVPGVSGAVGAFAELARGSQPFCRWLGCGLPLGELGGRLRPRASDARPH